MKGLSGVLRIAYLPAAVFVVLASTGCGDDDGTEPTPPLPLAGGLYLGGDVSALGRIEQAGGEFRTGGAAMSAIEALVANGANTFRLRLFVDPNHQEVQVNDLWYTIALAKRIEPTGARLLLDFHYSDTWADPGRQTTPDAWRNLDMDALEVRMEEYTRNAIELLGAEGALPDIVQVGNEIDSGLLWPTGRIGGSYDAPENFERFGRLLKAGVRGVRSATPAGDSIIVMLHYSQGGSIGGTRWFFDHVQAQGVPYDMIGLSYYPWWHGTLADLQANLEATALRYDKEIMVVETAYLWRDGWMPDFSDPSHMTWPTTPAGQADFLRDVVDAVRATPHDLGAGVIWWYPESIPVPGLFVYGGGALALFDDDGAALPAATVFGEY